MHQLERGPGVEDAGCDVGRKFAHAVACHGVRLQDQSLAEEALVQELISGTNDIKEGMRAFAEKRDPDFTGT